MVTRKDVSRSVISCRRVLRCLIGAALLASCGSGDLEDGVLVFRVNMDDLPVVRGEVVYSSDRLGRPRYLTYADDRIFVADESGEPHVHVIGTDGRYRNSFGKTGEGPGEFRYLSAIRHVNERICVSDPNMRKIACYPVDDPDDDSDVIETRLTGGDGLPLNPVMTDDRIFGLAMRLQQALQKSFSHTFSLTVLKGSGPGQKRLLKHLYSPESTIRATRHPVWNLAAGWEHLSLSGR